MLNKMTDWLRRTELILDEEKLQKLKNSNVLVVGLGGVGAFAAEMICRSGVGSMIIFILPTGTDSCQHLRVLKGGPKQR